MTYFRRVFCLFALFVTASSFLFSVDQFNGWTHLELGAGNYGPDGHTKASQAKTVLMKLKDVTDAQNYIDDLEDEGSGDYNPEHQYGVLFWTLDQLVERNGQEGVFHVNDLYEEYAVFAAQKLVDYALSKGYDDVIIEAVSGDYSLINPESMLSSYGRTKYDSAHLKNPEVSFYFDRMDGDNVYASKESRQQTRNLLETLANMSEQGLYLFILYHEYFVPKEEREEFIEPGIFYHQTEEWEAVPYIFPEGQVIDQSVGRVFHIEPTMENCEQ
jgi:hypothetical protein